MWIKIDDGFADHPKLQIVGALGLALQIASVCYSGRYLTDGFLSYSAAKKIIRGTLAPWTNRDGVVWTPGASSGHAARDADEFPWEEMMVTAGLWDAVEGGYKIHDYCEYNPTREEADRVREQRRESGRRGGLAKAKQTASKPLANALAKRKQNPAPSPSPSPSPLSSPEEPEITTSSEAPRSALRQKPASAKAAAARAISDPDFVDFWTRYPRKVGKGQAAKAWANLEQPDPEAIRKALAWQVGSEQWTSEAGRFIPHPSTYLNQRRWEDEPTAADTDPLRGVPANKRGIASYMLRKGISLDEVTR